MPTNTSTLSECPPTGDLDRLLRGRFTEARSAAMAEHVGGCSNCQKRLELLAGEGDDLPTKLREAESELPPTESAYWQALSAAELEIRSTTLALNISDNGSEDTQPETEKKLDFLLPSTEPGRLGRLGTFEIIREVGRGGMGVVLHAYDPCLQRDVAIKVIDPKLANNEVARQRFCREARAAAAVTHDNLVAVHQVDEDDASGLPYLVMQLVHGESLEQRLKRVGSLSVSDVARIGMQAAAGLAAAHAGGLIHRDIKPGNILLEDPVDRVKLTDFGLARAAEDVKLTRTGFVAGSPLYMAPEQARGEEVDHRADLFSLGSVLYEATTGTPPFDGKTPLAVLRRVADETPPLLSTVNAEVPNWLSDIVDKLLAKNPGDRFQSAAEVAETFAAELARTNAISPLDLPAEVCPSSSRSTTTRSRKPICWKSVAFRVLPWVGGAILGGLLMAMLAQPKVAERAAEASVSSPGPEPKWILQSESGSVWAVAFVPNSTYVVLGYEDGNVRIWNFERQSVLKTLERMNGTVWTADVSADGKYLVVACDDAVVTGWNLKTYNKEFPIPQPTSTKAAVFSPNALKLATGDRNSTVRIWDLIAQIPIELVGHRGTVHALAYSPDGTRLASGGSDGTAKIWNLNDLKADPLVLAEHKGAVYSVAFSPDGNKLATAGWDGTVRVWDVAKGTQLRTFHPQEGDVWSVSFGNNGNWLAFTVQDTVRVWEVETEKEIFKYHGTRAFHTVRFAPDGTTLAAGGRDGALRVWEVGK
ncbi:MAG TPA: serine/threonine-protein kinase [Gemmata sp.]|nr:serine/threonine-protein kinase [Gemmata sp.]